MERQTLPTSPRHSLLLARIGNTPLLELNRVAPPACATVYAKAEFLNPGGSIKDRIAKHILECAQQRALLTPESRILEVTSGNTGIAFAMVGTLLGYQVRIMMPKTVSVERRQMIEAFGAELELLDDLLGINAARERAEALARLDRRLFLPRQFANPDNAAAHEATTGPELLRQTGGRIDAFVMGVGTGGTLMGVGRALRRTLPNVQVVAVEPAESAVMSGGVAGCHGIQGLADGFIPEIVDLRQIDRIVAVATAEAVAMAGRLAREEGVFVGISSGANVVAALRIARDLGPGTTVVTVLPDRGERYLSVWSSGRPASA